ncbi:conserved hypothetical protein [Desulfamplus magnetovallimortis]|uniref:Putative restriction endonuclease domain-containing protein n=1 Tax=Desulfamplus magnetovallimortis TaxID=1246637 RepID=A0A1W1HH48_9BACT|nr:Uma2 family endonuclease [Desulfamplus magnetovallimortis]SLM31827.1 conserved hypothetical protein [Desulfamplus magnetovallimortis]
MNAQQQPNTSMTPEEYLIFEQNSEIRHEYFDGEIFAMTGASLNHNRINGNFFNEIKTQLKKSPCDAFSNDMRVKICTIGKYTYPDIVVVCGNIELENIMGIETLINPLVIIEILSDSTEAYDRGRKFQHYRFTPSLREYILVSQNHCFVEKYVRKDDNTWNLSSYENMKETMTIDTVKCQIYLSDIYYRVEFKKTNSYTVPDN